MIPFECVEQLAVKRFLIQLLHEKYKRKKNSGKSEFKV